MTEYRPSDQEEKLGKPPTTDKEAVKAWEAAHGHDVRLKCYPENSAVELLIVIDEITDEMVRRARDVLDECARPCASGCRR